MAITIGTAAGDISRTVVTSSSSHTTVGVSAPANVANGDLLILKLCQNDSLNPNTISMSGTGWTIISENYTQAGTTIAHTAAYYRHWATADPTSWTATFTADTRDSESFVTRVTGHDVTTPIDVAAGSYTSASTASPVCPSITTVTDGAVGIFIVSGETNVMTAQDSGQPTGTTLIQSKRTQSLSTCADSGLAYQLFTTAGATGTKTWTSWFTGSANTSAFSFAIRPSVTFVISSINSGAGIVSDSTGNTAITAGFTVAPDTATYGGKTCTITAATTTLTTFSFPAPIHATTYPEIGTSPSLVLTKSAESATKSALLSAPTGYTYISALVPNTTDATYLGPNLIVAPVDTDLFISKTADCTVGATGSITTDIAKITTVMHWVRATGVMYIYSLVINGGGVVSVTSNTGITEPHIANLFTASITSAGLTVH